MDENTLKWVIPLIAGVVGWIVGWFSKQFWLIISYRRQKEQDEIGKMKNGIDVLKEKIAKERNPLYKEQYESNLAEIENTMIELATKSARSLRRN